jgi:predicted trehalose synthase
MTGSDRYRKAEELTAKAHECLGQGEGQDSAAVGAAVAQIHATLALAAATALGTTAAGGAQSRLAPAGGCSTVRTWPGPPG